MNSNILSTRRLALLSAGVSLFGAAAAFGAGPGGAIAISSSPALSLGATGLTQGLVGTIWHVQPNDGSGSGQYGLPAAGDPTLADATTMESYINSGSSYNSTSGVTYTLPSPSETFLNTKDTFNYVSPYAESSFLPTSAFLQADAAGAAAVDQSAWTNSIIDQMGYIKVASAGTYTFKMSAADDAAEVFVGGTGITPSGNAGTGTPVVALGYDSNFNPVPTGAIPSTYGTANVSFSSAGYYPIEIMNYQEGGGAGMNLAVTAPSGGTAPSYWTTSALASSVTPTPTPPVASAPPTPTDEWNFAKSTISGSTVSDIGTAGSAATAGTVIGSAASVTGGQLVVTSNNSGNGMTVPGSTFTNYAGSFTVAVTFTRNANDPTANWGSAFALGTQNNPGAGFILFQPHRNDGSGYASFYMQPSTGGASGVINASGKPIPTGSLTQEVMVYNAATDQSLLYYNGVLQETTYIQLPAGVTSFDLAKYANYGGLGGIDPFNDPSMMGSYNDLSTWNSALTSGQIAGLYSATAAVPEPGDLALLGLGAMGMLLISRRKVQLSGR